MTLAPPSALSSVSASPESARMASATSLVWYAMDSTADLVRCAAVVPLVL